MTKSTLLAAFLVLGAALGASLPARAEPSEMPAARALDDRQQHSERRRTREARHSQNTDQDGSANERRRADEARPDRGGDLQAERRQLRRDVERARDEVYGRTSRRPQ